MGDETPGNTTEIAACKVEKEDAVAEVSNETEEEMSEFCKAMKTETEKAVGEIQAEAEAKAAEENATKAAEGAPTTRLYLKLKVKNSILEKFKMNRAQRKAPIFGSLTTVGGVVASCVLLAVAAGGYALGVRKQHAV